VADFETPKLGKHLVVPPIQPGAMDHSRPHIARPEQQTALGFPTELAPDWEHKAVFRLGELVSQSRALRVFLDSCVQCGACTEKCHYYLGTGDPNNMPVARQNLLRSVYRRYYTVAGKYAPWLVGARDMTKEVLDEWYTYFHQCSQCRRCSVYCPIGIDTAEISMAARDIMDTVGLGQKYSNEIIGKVHRLGNNLGLPGPALRNTLNGLEEDVREETGIDVKFPLDAKGADVLLVTPSADFFAEPHVDGLIGYAKVFHAAGISWTLSTHASEMSNFALFTGSQEHLKKVAMRIREAAVELGVDRRHHLGVAMPEQHRAMPAEIIDVAAPVDIPFSRPLRAVDVEPVRLDVARIVGDAAGKQRRRLRGAGGRAWGRGPVGGDDRRVGRQGVGHDGGSGSARAPFL